jgi:hypothetical protein
MDEASRRQALKRPALYFLSLWISLTRLPIPTAIGVMPTTSQNIRDPHQSSAVATIQIPKAIMPARDQICGAFPCSSSSRAGTLSFRFLANFSWKKFDPCIPKRNNRPDRRMENDATDPWNYLKAAATVPDRRRIRGSHSIRAPRQSAFERFNVHRTGDTFLETSKEQSRAVEPGVPLLK